MLPLPVFPTKSRFNPCRCLLRRGIADFLAIARWGLFCGLLIAPVHGQDTPKESDPALPLPSQPGLPPELQNSPNPLLWFDPNSKLPPEERNEASPDLLPPLSPFMPGEPVPPTVEPSAEERELTALAQKVAGSVVSIRVWDEFGGLLSSGVGCFVSADGLILTDTSLVHPEIADRIDYITTMAADGTNHRISGFYLANLQSGVTLLQSTGPAQPGLELRPDTDFSKPIACRVLAISEKRGLVLADAAVGLDDTLAGQGWLIIRGDFSPGGVGSPVLTADGGVIGMVGMRTPLKSWMNFALPIDNAAFEIQRKRPPLRPLSDLPRTPRIVQITSDPQFITAFQTLQRGRAGMATQMLLRLTKKYPRSAECWALLGLSAASMGATPDALSCQRKAVALDPQSGLYWHQMAQAQVRSRSAGDTAAVSDEEEFEALQKGTEQDPNDRLSWLILANHHLRKGNFSEADASLRRLTFLAPNYAQGFYLLAYVKSRLNDSQAALTAMERCLQLASKSANAWYFSGLLYDKLEDLKSAAEAYRKAVRLDPNHPNAWLNLAHSLKKAGRPSEASQAFREHQQRILAKTR